MKKLRILVATVGAALAIGAFPAPAQAAHHCAYPTVQDKLGVVHTVWVVCEYGYHDPVGVTKYIICWLNPAC